jgi:hypothetical protein
MKILYLLAALAVLGCAVEAANIDVNRVELEACSGPKCEAGQLTAQTDPLTVRDFFQI